MYNILVCDDEKDIVSALTIYLTTGGYQVFPAYDGTEALAILAKEDIHLVLLDIMMPKLDGIAAMTRLREVSNVPVILLTANDWETDIVAGLELGAEDYITKPFSLAVLRARVNAQLRRSSGESSTVVQVGPFTFDFGRMEYRKHGRLVDLSKTEQKLLRLLVQNRGTTLTRADLVDRIWTDGAEYVDENALSVTVKRLRDKLEDTPSKPQYLKTVYGVGYTWAVV